jgi:hypothetical protein
MKRQASQRVAKPSKKAAKLTEDKAAKAARSRASKDAARKRATRAAEFAEQTDARRDANSEGMRGARGAETSAQGAARRTAVAASTSARRARERSMNDAHHAAVPEGFRSRHWGQLKGLSRKWCALIETFIALMMVCSQCGTTTFGPTQHPGHGATGMTTMEVDDTTIRPPYSAANPMMPMPVMQPPGRVNTLWVCTKCEDPAVRAARVAYTAVCSPAYLLALHALGPFGVQFASVLDARVCVKERYNGFQQAEFGARRLLDQPLVTAGRPLEQAVKMVRTVKEILIRNHLRDTNAVYDSYLALAEQELPHTGFPLMDREAMRVVEEHHRTRGHVTIADEEMAQRLQLGVLVDDTPGANHIRYKTQGTKEYVVGFCAVRSDTLAGVKLELRTDAFGLPVASSDVQLTVEQACFTAYFPGGVGFWDGSIRFSEYCKMRMDDLYGIYSRCTFYTSVMYQMYNSITLMLASREIHFGEGPYASACSSLPYCPLSLLAWVPPHFRFQASAKIEEVPLSISDQIPTKSVVSTNFRPNPHQIPTKSPPNPHQIPTKSPPNYFGTPIDFEYPLV